MKQQVTNIHDFEGKTIEAAIRYGESTLLTFTDQTFAYLDLCSDECSPWVSLDAVDIEWHERGWWLSAGIITPDDVEQMRKKIDADQKKRVAEAKAARLKEFEQMKAEFEGVKP